MPAAGVTYQRTREMTIDELLLENRVVFLIGEINQASAARLIMQMFYLENLKRGQEIHFYINSPGGAVDDTLAIYDTMRFMTSPVSTYCIGRAYSGGAVLLTAGTKGKRYILPHAKVMTHQPYGVRRRPGRGHPHPGRADHQVQERTHPHPLPPYQPARGCRPARLRARQVLQRHGGQGVWPRG